MGSDESSAEHLDRGTGNQRGVRILGLHTIPAGVDEYLSKQQ